jgi:hypothetical protein
MPNQRGRNNPDTRDANAAQRAAMAVKLRSMKMTYDEISKQCGYSSAQSAHKAVQRELERVVVENIEELRKEEMESLQSLELECWKIFYDKNKDKSRLFAVDRILTIKERRAKLMMLDRRPEEEVMAQDYKKEIVLTHVVEANNAK